MCIYIYIFRFIRRVSTKEYWNRRFGATGLDPKCLWYKIYDSICTCIEEEVVFAILGCCCCCCCWFLLVGCWFLLSSSFWSSFRVSNYFQLLLFVIFLLLLRLLLSNLGVLPNTVIFHKRIRKVMFHHHQCVLFFSVATFLCVFCLFKCGDFESGNSVLVFLSRLPLIKQVGTIFRSWLSLVLNSFCID